MHIYMQFKKLLPPIVMHAYPTSKMIFSVNPTHAVAQAITNVMIPKVAWVGTKAALHAAVAPSQQRRMRKLKNPTTNCRE